MSACLCEQQREKMQHEAVISFSAVLIHLPKVLTYEWLQLNFKTLTKFSALVFKAQLGLCLPLALPETLSCLKCTPERLYVAE